MKPALRRIIAVGVVRNDSGEYLICRMPGDRGVFPGQWGLPGGGIEDGEKMEAALRRELHEEVGLEVTDVESLFFTDGAHTKKHADGSTNDVYMIFLLFGCRALGHEVTLNAEFTEAAWVARKNLARYDLNAATRHTFGRLGLLQGLASK